MMNIGNYMMLEQRLLLKMLKTLSNIEKNHWSPKKQDIEIR